MKQAFDQAAGSLPSGYRGHDCVAITAKMPVNFAARGEFESSEQYALRLKELATAPLLGGLKSSDVLAFPVGEFDLEMTYNADTKLASVGLRSARFESAWSGSKYFPAVGVATIGNTTRSFPATNGFGVRTVVKETTMRKCGIAVTNKEPTWLPAYSAVEFEIEAPAAQRLKQNLAAILIVRASPPYRAEMRGFLKATIDHPSQLIVEGPALAAELLDIWYYNRATGEIAARAEAKWASKFPAPSTNYIYPSEPAVKP